MSKSAQILTTLTLCLFVGTLVAQKSSKETKKMLEKRYACFSGHKPIYKNNNWNMVKFHIVYKLTSAQVSKAMDKNDYQKVKSSSGSYGILTGISEQDLLDITGKVAENFTKRMKDEAGITVKTWSSFKDSKNTAKLVEKADPSPEIYSKSQGLGYCVAVDGTPIWNKVIAIVPGGKKLAKETGGHNGMLTMYIDFAKMEASASAYVSNATKSGNYMVWKFSEGADQSIVTGVRLVPSMGSQNVWEAATNLGTTMCGVQSEMLHSWSMTYAGGNDENFTSTVPFATDVQEFKGQLPTVLANRSNNKIEYVKTFEVKTTPELYGKAVMDVTNKFFDDIITYYKVTSSK